MEKLNSFLVYENMPLIYDVFLSPDNKELYILFNSIYNLHKHSRYHSSYRSLKDNKIFHDLSKLEIKINGERRLYNWIGELEHKSLVIVKLDFKYSKLEISIIIEKFKYKVELAKRTDDFYNGKIGMMTLFKDENDILLNWIDYYSNLGVDYFFIYNNNPDNKNNYIEITTKYRHRVKYIDWGFPYHLEKWPSGKAQLAAMMHSLYKYRNMSWIGYFDLDEYIIPLKNKSIKNFIDEIEKKYKNIASIGLECMWFGCGRKAKYNEKNFLQKLTLCKGQTEKKLLKYSDKTPVYSKCFHNPKNVILVNVHFPITTNYEYIIIDPSIIRFNHYFTLSKFGKERIFTLEWNGCKCDEICKEENKDILEFIK